MATDVIFYTQIASVILFLLALFVPYRLLVSRKDSTVELLREKNQYLSEQIDQLKSQSPDILAENLSKRVRLLVEEIESLNQDREKNEAIIQEKESELHSLQSALALLQKQFTEAAATLKEFVCPYCGAPLSTKEYYPIYGHVQGREIDTDGEYITYECGLAVRDGREIEPCPSILGPEDDP